ncbi:RNA polymerase sigma-70 factor [Mucilaginibacter sp. JRF]|uniref:RNA polymerase sigma-70 factor n=1 Tax=Mucilaginibacter sp. JRF TaxID=2780088 RepID=UPI00187E9C74|nr:RNA polymerase sigma-70 factor [Mucilaginibacter sp. JRF]MBE9583157.1 RNA polymerase sigma-70 factor [Mucilaginibacter sp. JRF]
MLKQHNVHAFNELYLRYSKDMYAMAYKRLRSKEDVQDILQEVFVSLWHNAASIDEELPLGPYLFRALKNKIVDFFYKNKDRDIIPVILCDDKLEAKFNTDNERFLNKELETLLNNEIERLPEKMREVFILSRREYLSNDKIAERLSISSQTVKNQISLALKKLKLALDDYNAS